MLKVKSIRVEELYNGGCNNGNYPRYTIILDNDLQVMGMTCNCSRGCSNTDRLPSEGAVFKSEQDLRKYLEG